MSPPCSAATSPSIPEGDFSMAKKDSRGSGTRADHWGSLKYAKGSGDYGDAFTREELLKMREENET